MKPNEVTVPGMYLFLTSVGKKSYYRKFDGKFWYAGNLYLSGAIKSGTDKFAQSEINNWVRGGLTVELVADLEGNPWAGGVKFVPTQLDLFQ